VELEGAPVPIFLLSDRSLDTTLGGRGIRRDFSRHWTPIHLDFIVRDLEPAVSKAETAGAALEREIQTHAWGRMANMADPFGNGFDLIELSAGGYDALRYEP
jgi:predicted enzyme related to lactoylglutathione lyase